MLPSEMSSNNVDNSLEYSASSLLDLLQTQLKLNSAIRFSNRMLLGGQITPANVPNLFALLNSNYFTVSPSDSAIQETTAQVHSSAAPWILYQVSNCIIRRPIGLIEGPVVFEAVGTKLFTPDFCQFRNCLSEVVALSYNSANLNQQFDARQMKESLCKFVIKLEEKCQLEFFTKLGHILVRLEASSSISIAMDKFTIKNDDHFQDELSVTHKTSCIGKTVITVKHGRMRLLFDEHFSILTAGVDNLAFAIKYPNMPLEIAFASTALTTNDEKETTRTGISTTFKCETTQDKVEVAQHSSSNSNNNYLPSSFVQVKSLPEVINSCEYIKQSLSKEASVHNAKSESEDIIVEEIDIDDDGEDSPSIGSLVSLNEESSKTLVQFSKCNNEKSTTYPKESTKTRIDTFKSVTNKEPHTEKGEEIKNSKASVDSQKVLLTSEPHGDNSLKTQERPPPIEGVEPIYDLDQVKSILKSNSSVIIVNKVPLSLLNNFDTSATTNETFWPTQSHTTNPNVYYQQTSALLPPSTRNRDQQMITQNRWTTPNNRQNSSLTHGKTVADLSALKKKCIHEMQKSKQYLKFIKHYISNKVQASSDEHKVKMAFDKYGVKLRKQLVKTVDSVEQYISQLGLEQSVATVKNGGATSSTTPLDVLTNDDQEFFFDIIEKMRKLMSQMHVDMFRLICEEVEKCLIEINNKFFIN